MLLWMQRSLSGGGNVFALLGFPLILLLSNMVLAEDLPLRETEPSSREPVRIYRSPDERREAGLGTQITDWLKLGGVVELEHDLENEVSRNDNMSLSEDTPALAMEIGFEVNYEEWLEAEVLFAIEENGREHYQELDEALIGVDIEDFGLKVGWLYVPFGAFFSQFVTGPFLEIGQTRGPAIEVDYTFFDSLELTGYVLESRVDRHEDHNEVDWGVNIEFDSEDESIQIGVGYLSDLAEGDENILEDFRKIRRRRVPAWNAYALVGFEHMEFTAEVLRATHAFQEFPKNMDQPFAYNIEGTYIPTDELQCSLRVEFSEELIDEPRWQFGISGTWAPVQRMTVSMDYLYGDYKKGFVLDDDDIPLRNRHLIALQLTLGF